MSSIRSRTFWVIENTVRVLGNATYLQSSVEDFETFYMWVFDINKASQFGSQGEAETHATRLILGAGWFASEHTVLEN